MNDAKYMYHKNICEDIKSYLDENYKNIPYNELDFYDIFNELWICDQVTGNASGSYWFSTWKAEEAICHNIDLAIEALGELGYPDNVNAETIDVTIRCYLLHDCLRTVMYS